tara:strand:+ start:475 stop:735 length:261 start_codon:yes stop_codon:yes gene_type:complete
MDWNTFFFGFFSGVVSLASIVTFLAYLWMRPYLKEARSRLKPKESKKQTLSDVEVRAMAHLWEQQGKSMGWGGNDPWVHWKKRKTN